MKNVITSRTRHNCVLASVATFLYITAVLALTAQTSVAQTATLPGWVQGPGALVRPEEPIPSSDLAQYSGPTASVLAGQDTDGAVDPESLAKAEWRASMRQNPTPDEGCFHASYPNMSWESVECKTARPHFHLAHAKPTDPEPALVGNTHDYVAKSKGFITAAFGIFNIEGVKSEKSVGVAGFHDDGILGPNEYTVQINTNNLLTTGACANGNNGCHVWQQFVYATNYGADPAGQPIAAVFMQYWLLGYGDDCPSGWNQDHSNCWKNSQLSGAPDVPATDLGEVRLEGAASSGGVDSVTFEYKTDLYNVTASDSVLDIASVWNKAETNVLGDTGGSRAIFNDGSSITVKLELVDGSKSAPTCVASDGTTGETNNLNLGTCEAFGGRPYIQFNESN